MGLTEPRLTCDMASDCQAEVTHIDCKGYVYCAVHGQERKSYQRCRRLTPAERRQLLREEPLSAY